MRDERQEPVEPQDDDCQYCYAEAFNMRNLPNRGTGLPFTASSLEQVEIVIDEKTLRKPLEWKEPRTIFVCSMTDLFGEFVIWDALDEIFAVMYECQWHTFQVLTKRPERMAEYLGSPATQNRIAHKVWWRLHARDLEKAKLVSPGAISMDLCDLWPLPNIHLGTTVESQQYLDRCDPLFQCPAVSRFLSVEPLLGPIKFANMKFIDWVIVGGESGHSARPMKRDWVRSIRDQCVEAGVPFFFKQWGSIGPDGVRRSKEENGRLLDGEEWNQMPEVTHAST